MVLYKRYLNLFKQQNIVTGFSSRVPDYGVRYSISKLEKAISFSKKNSFLDVGAGLGRMSVLLASSCFKTGYSIEVKVDKPSWKQILEKHKNINLIEGLLQENIGVLKSKEKINFVVLSEVFEHIPLTDVESFLGSLHEVLDEDGIVFLTTPNLVVQGPAEKSVRWYKKVPFGHHKHYKFDELKDILDKHGFKIIFNSFEGSFFKRNFYNRFYYPFSRLDQKLLVSKKIPKFLNNLYKYFSYPFIPIIKGFFWSLAKVVYFYENKFGSEKNSETMILVLKKRD